MTYLCVSIKTGSCLQKLEEIATEDTGVRNKLQSSYRVATEYRPRHAAAGLARPVTSAPAHCAISVSSKHCLEI